MCIWQRRARSQGGNSGSVTVGPLTAEHAWSTGECSHGSCRVSSASWGGWSIWRWLWLTLGSPSSVGIPSAQGLVLLSVGREHPSPEARSGPVVLLRSLCRALTAHVLERAPHPPTHTGSVGLACSWHCVPVRSWLQHPVSGSFSALSSLPEFVFLF